MKKLLGLMCAIVLLSGKVFAADPSVVFVKDLTDDIITNVLTSDVSQEQKFERFKTAFEDALDMRSVGQFVLGVYWRRADEAQREAFLDAFIDFTTKTWADRFDLYTGQKIVFSGTRNAEGNQLYVNSQIQNNPPVEVIWRLKKMKNGNFKIIDIIVEGVSMAMSYRNEYSAFLQKHGGKLPMLTQELERKSAAFKFTNAKSKNKK